MWTISYVFTIIWSQMRYQNRHNRSVSLTQIGVKKVKNRDFVFEMKNVKKAVVLAEAMAADQVVCFKRTNWFLFDLQDNRRGWSSYTGNHKLRIMRMLAECYNQHSFICCMVLLCTQRLYFTCMFLVLWTRNQPFGTCHEVLRICSVSLLWCSC